MNSQTDIIPDLDNVIEDAVKAKIRLLIEVELSGKMYIYCDTHDRKTVLRLIRKYKIPNKKRWLTGGYDMRFESDSPGYKLLGWNKGKFFQRKRKRTLVFKKIKGHKCWFFDLDEDRISKIGKLVSSDYEEMANNVITIKGVITVNRDKSNYIFYGR